MRSIESRDDLYTTLFGDPVTFLLFLYQPESLYCNWICDLTSSWWNITFLVIRSRLEENANARYTVKIDKTAQMEIPINAMKNARSYTAFKTLINAMGSLL